MSFPKLLRFLPLIWLLLMFFDLASANFFYQESEARCGASICKKADYFHYYNCHGNVCDFHLQPWLFAVISFIVLSFLLSLVCSLLKCICCSDRR